MLKLKCWSFVALFALVQCLSAGDAPRKAVIFTANHADKTLNDKLPALEDFVAGRVTEKGFTIVSREVATDALNSLRKDSPQTEADQLLASGSTALRLAQMLGADYIVLVSISSYGTEKRTSTAYDVATVNVIHNLRVTYKVLDGVQGGTLAGDTFKVSRVTRAAGTDTVEDSDVLNGLLDDASVKVAESVGSRQLKAVDASAKSVSLSVVCTMQDLAQLPVGLPELQQGKDGKWVVGTNKVSLQALDVTVEMDGVVAGSAPGAFKTVPGLHKLRLSREGFKTWERTINVVDGQKLIVALQMSEAGYQRWKDNTAFLESMEAGRKLTDAEVKRIEGEAQMLRQSGYKVDTDENVRVYKSLY